MTTPRGNLPPINFAEKSATEVESHIITGYEAIANRSLAPGDPVRLFLEAVAAIIINQRSIIDFSAKQNLLSYAQDEYIDYLAELVGVTRNDAEPAKTTIEFRLSTTQASVYTIPAGTEVAAGQLAFSTTEALEIPIGEIEGQVIAECTESGTVGNNLLPGQIRTIVEPSDIPFVQSAANTTTSNGGAAREDDESLVQRIRLAPSSFSVAGPSDAYVYWSLTANQAIIDVAVSSPEPDDIKQIVYDVLASHGADPALVSDMETALDNATWPGTVDVRPLLENGVIPGQEVLDQVNDALSAENIRPLTDEVLVQAPDAVDYTVNVGYYIRGSDARESLKIQNDVDAAVEGYILWQNSVIGRDINPDELSRRIINAGAKRLEINSPAFTVLDETQVAQDLSVTVNYLGLEDA